MTLVEPMKALSEDAGQGLCNDDVLLAIDNV